MQDVVLVQHWVVELHQAQAMQAEAVDLQFEVVQEAQVMQDAKADLQLQVVHADQRLQEHQT
jgi:Zn finger protein HypA/HybF involved in hydrogenase expression